MELAARDTIRTHGEHAAQVAAYEENKRQSQAVDEWLDAVVGVGGIGDQAVKKELCSALSSVSDKQGKDVVIDISDEEE
jgi:hypothetical protein